MVVLEVNWKRIVNVKNYQIGIAADWTGIKLNGQLMKWKKFVVILVTWYELNEVDGVTTMSKSG